MESFHSKHALSSWYASSYHLQGRELQHFSALYRYQGPTWGMSAIKGSFAEGVASSGFASGLFEKTSRSWMPITPHRTGAAGIDILFVKLDSAGRPCSLMVGEVKFGTSQLGEVTRDGKQMGWQWISKRLHQTAMRYEEHLASIRHGGLQRVNRPLTKGLVVPMQDGNQITVSIGEDGLCRYYSKKLNISADDLKRKIRRLSSYLNNAAEGLVPYKSRLVNVRTSKNQWNISIKKLNKSADSVGVLKEYNGKAQELPKKIQRFLRGWLKTTLLERGVAAPAVKQKVEDIVNDPQLFKQYQPTPKQSWKIGLDRGMFGAAVSGMALSAIMEILTSTFRGQSVNWGNLGKVAVISGASASAGYYVATQVQARLVTTEVGKKLLEAMPGRLGTLITASMGASASAGVASAIVFSYGAYFLGYMELKDAHHSAISGAAGALAGFAFSAGLLGGFMAFGTAGTGIAISTLSGAAATNAALAALGGGTVAVGGGGMALGSTVLTGGTAIVVIVVAGGYAFIRSQLNERECFQLAGGRISLAEKHIQII